MSEGSCAPDHEGTGCGARLARKVSELVEDPVPPEGGLGGAQLPLDFAPGYPAGRRAPGHRDRGSALSNRPQRLWRQARGEGTMD